MLVCLLLLLVVVDSTAANVVYLHPTVLTLSDIWTTG